MLKIENGKPIIYKTSELMGELMFKEVDKLLAKKIIVDNHYSHKWCSNFGVVNIGIFKSDAPNKCLGVASFGWPMFPRSYKSVASNIKVDEFIELNRLWIDDCLGRNAETMLLSASWKILKYYGKYRVVQSFADGRLGCGTIYKASSFKYYGYKKSSFLEDKETNEIWFGGMFTKTCSPNTLLMLVKKLCKNELNAMVVNSYRYIYVLDKSVDMILKDEPYPEYQKGSEIVDCDRIFTEMPSSFGGETRGCSGAVFRGYIIAKATNDYDGMKCIANKLLKYYTECEIDEFFEKQKLNEELVKRYSSCDFMINRIDWYNDLVESSQLVVEEPKTNYTELWW